MGTIQLGSYHPTIGLDRNLLLKFFDPLSHSPIRKQFFPICLQHLRHATYLPPFLTTDLADFP